MNCFAREYATDRYMLYTVAFVGSRRNSILWSRRNVRPVRRVRAQVWPSERLDAMTIASWRSAVKLR